jgi:UPF0716 family protein affecting phage T7 exclusion
LILNLLSNVHGLLVNAYRWWRAVHACRHGQGKEQSQGQEGDMDKGKDQDKDKDKDRDMEFAKFFQGPTRDHCP